MKRVRLHPGGNEMAPGKILCLGRNYPEHAREMNAPVPEEPVVFLKPSSALLPGGGRVVFPPFSREMHHEVEMVLLLGSEARNIALQDAPRCIAGYGVGLDMTLRDIQAEAKRKGLPWTVAKGFDTSAPVSDFLRSELVEDPAGLRLSLEVNGVLRQEASAEEMIFPPCEVLVWLSRIFTLEPGDLVFLGTPAGVGPVRPGDRLRARLQGVAELSVEIVSPEPS
ncbi:MAG: fumarylacetoacetate hydrolase family protein [Bacteroidota bacterium]